MGIEAARPRRITPHDTATKRDGIRGVAEHVFAEDARSRTHERDDDEHPNPDTRHRRVHHGVIEDARRALLAKTRAPDPRRAISCPTSGEA